MQTNSNKFVHFNIYNRKAPIFAAMKGKTYQEQKAAKRFSVLTGNGEVLGVWGNLKKLSEDMKEEDPEFLSYWTLVRKEENPVKFETGEGEEKKEYAIYTEKLR